MRRALLPSQHLGMVCDEDDYDLIESLRAEGFSQAILAAKLGITRRILEKILKRDERARAAYDAGNAALEEDLVGTLIQKARDGDNAALIFSLKSMFGYSDRGPIKVEHEHRVAIEIPAALTLAEFKALGQGDTNADVEEAEIVDSE